MKSARAKLLAGVAGLASLVIGFAAGMTNAVCAQSNNSRDLLVYYATTRLNESPSGRPLYNGVRHLNLGQGSTDYGVVSYLRPDDGASTSQATSWDQLRQIMNSRDTYWKQASPGQQTQMTEMEMLNRVRDFHGLICIYVHGYDETFQEATGELAELVDEYKRRNPQANILPILFTWPSPGNTADYTGDEANLEWSEQPFREFIDKVAAAKPMDSYIDFVAHSMGSRYAFAYGSAKSMAPRAVFRNVILSCSDMDYHTAEQKKEDLQRVVERNVYVLTNDSDKPLLTSQVLHGQPRLGRPVDSGTQIRQSASGIIGSGASGLLSGKSKTELLSQVTKNSKFLSQISSLAGNYLAKDNTLAPRENDDVTSWLIARPFISREWGAKARLVDTTGLVTINMGHRLAWPLVSGLILPEATYSPFTVTSIHKKPDALLMKQMGGTPLYLYRYDKIDLSRLAR